VLGFALVRRDLGGVAASRRRCSGESSGSVFAAVIATMTRV